MITVNIYKQSNYPVSAKKVKDAVANTFLENGVQSEAEASVAIVSHNKMIEYAKTYLKETEDEAKDHPVLSFPTSELEGPFQFPPDKTLHLGEIIVSYQKAVEAAKKENKLVDEVVAELACHGALHLVGIHHD